MEYGPKEYEQRIEKALQDGLLVVTATICPDCHHVVPRRLDPRKSLIRDKAVPFCACGLITTSETDRGAHEAPAVFYHGLRARVD